MDSIFDNLKREYSLPTTSSQRQSEILEEMRANLKARNGGKDIIEDSPYILQGAIKISTATREELYNADNILGNSGL